MGRGVLLLYSLLQGPSPLAADIEEHDHRVHTKEQDQSAYTEEEDLRFRQFVTFGLELRKQFLGGRSRQRREARDPPGFYALPLPHLPRDVQGNLNSMQLVGRAPAP